MHGISYLFSCRQSTFTMGLITRSHEGWGRHGPSNDGILHCLAQVSKMTLELICQTASSYIAATWENDISDDESHCEGGLLEKRDKIHCIYHALGHHAEVSCWRCLVRALWQWGIYTDCEVALGQWPQEVKRSWSVHCWFPSVDFPPAHCSRQVDCMFSWSNERLASRADSMWLSLYSIVQLLCWRFSITASSTSSIIR